MIRLGNIRFGRTLARAAATSVIAAAASLSLAIPALAWEPTKPVEFIVPAGTGGGADQMARLIRASSSSTS